MRAADRHVQCVELQTDQPGERVETHFPTWLPGVSFWNVSGSTRLWSMHHDTFTASLVLGLGASMRAKWRSRGEERIAARGHLQLMEPGETHRTTAVSEAASFFVLWWSPSVMEDAARSLGAVFGGLHFREAQLDPSEITEAFERLHRAVRARAEPLEIEHFYAQATLLLLEGATERGGLRVKSGRRHPGVRRAIELLSDRYASNLSLDDLALEAKLSKFHLARCFQEATGVAPHQYQKLLRLQAARRLLESGSSVNEAAERSGFADAPHFARAFRAWLGVTPSQWAGARRRAWG